MNVKKATIIKTQSDKETELAKRSRNVLTQSGEYVVLVPYGVTELFITLDENDDLIIMLQRTYNGYNPVDIDIVTGFGSVAECWEYAELVIKEAGLPEDSCDADVWE